MHIFCCNIVNVRDKKLKMVILESGLPGSKKL
jgi:hypothetical protein